MPAPILRRDYLSAHSGHFGRNGRKACLTILYGPPDQISQMGAAAIAWSYRHVDGVGDNIGVVFENQGNGEYLLLPAYTASDKA